MSSYYTISLTDTNFTYTYAFLVSPVFASLQVCDPHRIRKIALERKKKDPNSPGCIVYSIGSNGNFMFELALQVRGDDFIDVLSHS